MDPTEKSHSGTTMMRLISCRYLETIISSQSCCWSIRILRRTNWSMHHFMPKRQGKSFSGYNLSCRAFLLQTVVYNKEKPAFDSKKLAIQDERLAIGHKKLSIEILRSAIKKQNYNEPTIKNMITICDVIETDQIFGASEVKNILKCSMSTSKEIMKKLRDIEVVRSVKGKGKPKYRFVNSEEIEK